MADHRGQPGAGDQRHQARCTDHYAAARGRRGGARQDQSQRMGQHPRQQLDQRLERDWRADQEPACARPQCLRVFVGQRGGGRGRACLGSNRHRDQRLDHLPRQCQWRGRVQADRRDAQPHPYRADQRDAGHSRPDRAERRRRGAATRRDGGQRPRRSRDCRSGYAAQRFRRWARRRIASGCADRGSAQTGGQGRACRSGIR